MGKVRVGFLEEVAPGLGLEEFAGRMTLGEDLLWRSMGGRWSVGWALEVGVSPFLWESREGAHPARREVTALALARGW